VLCSDQLVIIGLLFKVSSLLVEVRGEKVIDGTTGGKVEVDECTWSFTSSKDELLIMLTKVGRRTDAWRDLLA